MPTSNAPRPLIGLTTCIDPGRTWRPGFDYLYLNAAYARAVTAAGGAPVLVPPGAVAAVAALDALVITGGADVHPRHYGATIEGSIDLEVEDRVAGDRALIDAARAHGVPILGVCYGMQLLAVHGGGTLLQRLPETHGAPRDERRHAVDLRPGSAVAAAYGAARIEVVSAHRQAVDRVPAGLQITGRALDGCVEAIEAPGIVGVQWHPEAADDAGALYGWLVREALRLRSART
ncbi:MAG: gamma-glutamyl-gamma-aminobutyrate hydrolase family protein [Myxococcales bacterium]|nr:gamma-glutamyl-gamma-aminobutyrate hydrolase family protein [Myxococcales bacterium]